MGGTSMGGEGYSLIEMLLVLAVAATMGIVAATTFASMAPYFRLKDAATQIRGDLRWGRTLAVARNVEHRLVFDAGGDVYWIDRGNKAAKSDVWTPEEGNRRFPRGVDLSDVTFYTQGLGADIIKFNPNGTVEGVSGSAYLKNAEECTCSSSSPPTKDCRDHCLRVRVIGATGQVHVQAWDGKQWK